MDGFSSPDNRYRDSALLTTPPRHTLNNTELSLAHVCHAMLYTVLNMQIISLYQLAKSLLSKFLRPVSALSFNNQTNRKNLLYKYDQLKMEKS